MIPHLSLFVLAFFVSLCLTPTVRAAARWGGVVDLPDGRRRVHSRSIPRLGGVAIFAAFYCSLWALAGSLEHPEIHETHRLASAMFVPSLLVLLLGVADDLWSVGPAMKIAAQLIAGLLIYYHMGIRIEFLTNPFTGTATLALLSLPATLFWIVLVTNAFNIVDGMDGLAAGVGFIALSCMFLVSLQMGNMAIALVVAPLAGAVLGFLRYNFNPASIFLGDSGSLFLGFQLAVLSIVGSQKSSTAIAVTAPLFILALPLVETAISTVRRFLRGARSCRRTPGTFITG
jgi:UDP-GlcNAc:undecaprenyl-phosphate GlcNAc-1-phosphate transferase